MKRSRSLARSNASDESRRLGLRDWIKRVGLLGLVFFLIKGLLWLTIPALIAILAD